MISLVPQVGFRKELEVNWKWYRESDLTPDRLDEFRHSRFLILGDPNDLTRIVSCLEAIGCPVQEAKMTEGFPPGAETKQPIWVEVRYAIDGIVLRTIAKIAFNYLAKVTEDRVPDFIRRREFDPIRRYVRFGEKPDWRVVTLTQKKMLLGDSQRHRLTDGHLVSVSWPDPRAVPLGKVSLFNQITYVVKLTNDVPGIWWELDSGHLFDIETRTMSKLSNVNPIVLSR